MAAKTISSGSAPTREQAKVSHLAQEHLSAAGESLPIEAGHRGGDLPPWACDDLFFDPPNSIFASLGGDDPPAPADQLFVRDPWAEAAQVSRNTNTYTGLLFGQQPLQTAGSLSSRVGRPTEPAGQPQVSHGDELSAVDAMGRLSLRPRSQP